MKYLLLISQLLISYLLYAQNPYCIGDSLTFVTEDICEFTAHYYHPFGTNQIPVEVDIEIIENTIKIPVPASLIELDSIVFCVNCGDVDCLYSDTIKLFENPEISLNIEEATICKGDSINLKVAGGDTYLWNTEPDTDSIWVQPNSTIMYRVEAIKNMCKAIDSVMIKSKSPCPKKRNAYWQNEKYLKKELAKNAFPDLNANIRVTEMGSELKLIYSFDDETNGYDANRQPHIKALLQYIANQMSDLTDDCQTPHFSEITALIIHANHRESEEELKFGSSTEYQGDWGTNINAKYILEGNNKETKIEKGAITNEEMIYLKLWSIQKIMSHNTDVPEDKCTYRISTNNTSLEASMRTVITIKLK